MLFLDIHFVLLCSGSLVQAQFREESTVFLILINNVSVLLQSVLEGKLFYSSVPGQVSIRTMEDICDTVG